MSVIAWSWTLMVFFIGLMLYLGYAGMKKTKNADDFATARSSYGPIALGLAVCATTASGSTFMGIPGTAYTSGFPSLWYPMIYPIGIYGGMLLTAKMVKQMGDKFSNRTIPEIVGERFNSEFLRVGLALLSLLLIFYIVSQLVAAALMFQTMMGLSYQAGLWLTAIVLGIYLVLGGSHSDILTDAVQGFLMLIIAVMITVMFFTGFGVEGGVSAVNDAITAKNPQGGWDTLFIEGHNTYGSAWLVFLILIAHIPFGVLPHIGNKFFALKNGKQMRVFLSFCIIGGALLPMMALGGLLGAAVIPGTLESADAVIPALFVEVFPPFAAALMAVVVLSAILSTGDGLVVSFSQIFANDLYRKTLAKNNPDKEKVERNSLIIGRVAVVACLGLGILLAYNPPQSLAMFLWIGVGGMVSGLAGPLAIGALWKRANKQGAITSFCVGVISYAVLYMGWIPGLEAITNPFAASGYSILVASAVMVVVTLLTKPMSQEFIDNIYGTEVAVPDSKTISQ
ncbi:sodium:solute symporter family protein [Bacillus sp. ISL-47]|uniref:sodium:solute symporter family protein n=1 Tax=Bacillus sp. ISL-47 TaxID=2819130 RepID=UPI001BE747E1|nr:sodium:solute symporter family protein [Bacillus sp. ISL-47]MBT2687429.1 sodium:solute symporter family protein [Bacillus sp. ISL-47]MBT2707109.1 sodium:solute symporter family protein [Pseudomonas sp. ISL-84]